MPSKAELDQARRALKRLSQAADGLLRDAWADLRTTDRMVLNRALRDGWLDMIEQFGDMAATLGADLFESHAADLGIRPRVELAPGINRDRAAARFGWAASTPDPLGNLRVLTDELVKQPYRSTYQDSAIKSGAGWARVPTGSDTCAWCLMLASRGAVYSTAQAAGRGKKYHGDCDCAPTLVRSPEDYPEGYRPDDLYDAYSTARREAGSGNTKAILSALREQQGVA